MIENTASSTMKTRATSTLRSIALLVVILAAGCETEGDGRAKKGTPDAAPAVSRAKPVITPVKTDAEKIPENARLISLALTREQLGDVEARDHVDIHALFEVKGNASLTGEDPPWEGHVAMLMLQHMQVHKVHCKEGADVCHASLFTSVEEGDLLTLSTSKGELWFARRASADSTFQPVVKRTLKEALMDLEIYQKQREVRAKKGELQGKGGASLLGDERRRVCDLPGMTNVLVLGAGEFAATYTFPEHNQEVIDLQRGDWLDISMTFEPEPRDYLDVKGVTVMKLDLVQRARLLAIDEQRLTLLLTMEEVHLLKLAQRRGTLRYTVRAGDDTKIRAVMKHELKDLLQQLEVIPSRRVERIKSNRRKPSSLGTSTSRKKPSPPPLTPRHNAASNAEHSTFAVDVDAGAYTRMRDMVRQGTLPAPSEVRAEEYLNYFDWDLPQPPANQQLGIYLEATPNPMVPAALHDARHIVRVSLKARDIEPAARKPAHLTFLVDTSGSMLQEGRLARVKDALRVLVSNLGERDTVSLVTYAGSAEVILEHTGINQRDNLLAAINKLRPGGATAMQSGLKYAYQSAARGFVEGEINRVIVLSDGIANVGETDHLAMLATVQSQIAKGIAMSTIGVGRDGYHDTLMERLADKGDGNYYFIDSYDEIQRVFLEQIDGTLQLVARDAKVQVTFDKSKVSAHRLIGYENRALKSEDFEDDSVDAGDMGAGHEVTALYEVSLLPAQTIDGALSVSLRYRGEEDGKQHQVTRALEANDVRALEDASAAQRFALAVVAFAEILRDSEVGKKLYFQPFYDLVMEGEGARYVESDPRKLEFIELYSEVWGLIGCGQR